MWEKIKNFIIKIVKFCIFFSQRVTESAIAAYSGQSAFMLILSFFPFLLFLLTIIKYTPITEDLLISLTDSFFPKSFHSFVYTLINELFSKSTPSVLSMTVVFSLWLGSKSSLALSTGLDSVFNIKENRNYFILRFFSIIYTIMFAFIIIFTLIVIVFGNALVAYLKNKYPIAIGILDLIMSVRSSTAFILMFILFTLIYKVMPNHHVSLISQMPGALISMIGWFGFSYIYSLYIDSYCNYASFYGTMTTIALLMVWLYACMYILLVGGLINSLIMEFFYNTKK